ncbi:hypothetical protein AALP_AA8G234600 [Arabis alpina]|uniref:Late embryogenesis abundant protein LEA-2 subgroup domain-containing protein n=1 Tax=Arabis alpina TaxID=50452 RepID=A0A087G8Y4_ARAAL|nr:hypothetical protein AALP_AA8G234600 [Arabis alpina]
MASPSNSYEVPEVVTGYPIMPPSSSSSSSTLRGWWSRPIATYPASNDREPTCSESIAFLTPGCGGIFTVIAVFWIFYLLMDRSLPHAKFSIQSITVSPSPSATWQVEFLVKNPSSRYSIYYDGDDASVRLGPLNVAVLDVSHRRESRDVTALSLAFVAQNDVVSEELHVKLRGKHKRFLDGLAELVTRKSCYLELFANSISVSNASNADWRIGFVATTPVTGCNFSLNTIQSRLLRGGQVISEISPSLDSLGQPVSVGETDGPVTTIGFKNVATPGVIDGGVVWDNRVELVTSVNVEGGLIYRNRGVLTVVCGGLPVKFTADPAGNMAGSLFGYMRRCEYLFRQDKRWTRYGS